MINFSGSATDPQDGTLPASALKWDLIMQHCPSNCHSHPVQSFVEVSSGSFTAPDHEYPSYLELKLTATDSGGLTDTKVLRLDPKTVTLTFQTNPGGLSLTVGSTTAKAPVHPHGDHRLKQQHQRPVIPEQRFEVLQFPILVRRRCPHPHITAPASATTYTARYR